MTRNEFIAILKKSLAELEALTVIEENVTYYETYIDDEIRAGRSEAEVMEGLGDPRLIAKTILTAACESGATGAEHVSGECAEADGASSEGNQGIRKLPGWLFALIAVAAVFLVLFIIISFVSFLLPIAVPVLVVLFIIKVLQNSNK